ncbi:DNA topoisomerase VI, B subunit [Methanocella conradii HZ254]|uniref:Type 2 DNA topoisomerase 6 subunit B n=1 Tax=Methanocella conradii (strain DSM 24694 / JCM 17849 / CGMCC 1.5162 / HZ254) TaxID=1041930 RepID=H8I7Z6_METCZ|nr:DNA topoisomerase VI subunit B [Methanocella conradii]AFD00396.1 DNA topoisomerase VI, B subunit [Methanocella conradii HZ254]
MNSRASDAPIAVELAKKQKAISVAEFFEKNRQMLGFDSLPRSLITCVKEAVDNSLDACEEASILPDIYIRIKKVDERILSVVVEDNGPGVQRDVLPRVFGKLLYGSRFHAIRQSRGQQGIGISAAVLYAQLTSGKPARITSRIDPKLPAYVYELKIDTETNEPKIISENYDDFFTSRGTRIELSLEATYVRGKQSVLEYLRNTAIVNPHARITLVDPYDEKFVFERACDVLPRQPVEIKPHPHGIELGTLVKMLQSTDSHRLSTFLSSSFAKIGGHTMESICREASLDPGMSPQELAKDIEAVKRLLAAFQKIKIMAPPKDCLSPITDDLLKKGITQNHRVDFISTVSRPVSVYRGNPFLVEAAIAYGGDIDSEGRAEIYRFANRVPLMYQQGACAITHAIERINWKNYGLEQPKGAKAPIGPLMIMVHVASTNVPFTSESKDAIADIPEIEDEIELAVREAARDLGRYLSEQKKALDARKKIKMFEAYTRELAIALEGLTGKDHTVIESKFMEVLSKKYSRFVGPEEAEENGPQ